MAKAAAPEVKVRRGRPFRSAVRQNMIDVLGYMGSAYGYEIYKHYKALFPKVTLRLIYYHLRTGSVLGEFVQDQVRKEKGDFSWGSQSEQHIYRLGKNANPRKSTELESHFKKKPHAPV